MSNEKESKSFIEIIYEGIMFILAFTAVATIWYQTRYDSIIVWGTWAVFFVDFLIRFISSKNKLQFIKSNPFILIAIIPLDAIFQLARVARLLHFMRLKVITKYYAKPLIQKLERQKLLYVLPLPFLFVFIFIIPLYVLEPKLESYYESFIGGLASLVFFGYSTIDPQTTLGTIIITLLTIFGVVMHGVILSFIFTAVTNSTLFQNGIKKFKKRKGIHYN